jgi:N6-L-threonylcarbamoyladenine synthase
MAPPPAAEDTPRPAAPIPDRFVALVVSGGHSSLYRVDGGAIDTLGETRDDAMGEAFDKVGKRLGLRYPQGPLLDRLAELGDPDASPFPVPRCGDSLDLSYSGLKSQALQAIQKLEAGGVFEPPISGVERRERPDDEWPREVHDLAAGFRAAAVGQLLDRLERLATGPGTPPAPSGADGESSEKTVLAVSGGAAANRLLRRRLATWADERGIDLRLVPLAYSGDNAAMIAHAALVADRMSDVSRDPLAALAVEAQSRLPLGRTAPADG